MTPRILTGVMLSLLRTEVYWSSERRCSLRIRRGDFVAIWHTPSYHSSGQTAEKTETMQFTVSHFNFTPQIFFYKLPVTARNLVFRVQTDIKNMELIFWIPLISRNIYISNIWMAIMYQFYNININKINKKFFKWKCFREQEKSF